MSLVSNIKDEADYDEDYEADYDAEDLRTLNDSSDEDDEFERPDCIQQ